MNPNPLSDREKALENQWIRERDFVGIGIVETAGLTERRKQLAKQRSAKKDTAKETAKDSGSGAGSRKGQEQTGQEKK
ncbi:c1da536f-53b4-4886-85ac-91f2e4a76e1a [Thermothielavioides terrestris]|uniref:C1da536f-53b4-4886-85ac-91f2e4a76e1a n=1 Tax=Thermothielavioides terrestris TaxID=2587410 RepID=A0A446BPB3_9PEZI|nr:c1da536f-53b4-4886-85ac-91f2e4a76e1a [Thermothielavioides terrestris]